MQAIILKKIPIKEYDELIVCYTKDFGKMTYIAKSIMRSTSKQASHLDVLNLVDFSLVSKNPSTMPIITSSYSLNNFGYLKNSLEALAISNYILEIFDKFVFKEDPDPVLWDFLNNKLRSLNILANNESGAEWNTVLVSTQSEISTVLGYDETVDLEDIIQSRLYSLQFVRMVINR